MQNLPPKIEKYATMLAKDSERITEECLGIVGSVTKTWLELNLICRTGKLFTASLSYLVRRTGLSRHTVIVSIKELERLGFIFVLRKKTDDAVKDKINEYRLLKGAYSDDYLKAKAVAKKAKDYNKKKKTAASPDPAASAENTKEKDTASPDPVSHANTASEDSATNALTDSANNAPGVVQDNSKSDAHILINHTLLSKGSQPALGNNECMVALKENPKPKNQIANPACGGLGDPAPIASDEKAKRKRAGPTSAVTGLPNLDEYGLDRNDILWPVARKNHILEMRKKQEQGVSANG